MQDAPQNIWRYTINFFNHVEKIENEWNINHDVLFSECCKNENLLDCFEFT